MLKKIKYGPYSPSRLTTAACPFRFKKQYIDKEVKDHGSGASKRGNVIHEVFEEITKGWIHDQPLTWSQVEDWLGRKITEYSVVDRDDRMLCIQACQAYMLNPPQGLEHVLGTEEHAAIKWSEESEKFVECGWEDPDCYARGKIDILLIEGDVATIIDHKTQPFIEAANTFQMGVYSWLIKTIYPYVREVRTVLHFCRPDLDRYSFPYTWDDQAIKDIETMFKIEVQMIETMDLFPYNSNFYCTYCPLKMNCAEIDKLSKLRTRYGKITGGPLLSAQEAQEAFQVLNVVDEGRKVITSKIRDFTKEIGAIIIPGKEIGFKTASGWDVSHGNKRPLIDMLDTMGLDSMTYVKIDTVKLAKAWPKLSKKNLEDIKGLLTATKTSRFGSRKV